MLVGHGHGQVVPDAEAPKDRARVIELVDDYQKFDIEKIKEVVKAFLNAGTVTERAKYVRDAKRVEPLMKKYYRGEKLKAEGFESFETSQTSDRGTLLTTSWSLAEASIPLPGMRIRIRS
ncbi:MAG: hypothetical protein ACJAVK_000627 [Akkermansiaceae bacterium]